MGDVNGSRLIPRNLAPNGQDGTRLRHAREQHDGFPVGRYLQPAPMLFTRDGHNVFLGDMYRGRTAFLVCSGPSLNQHDLSQLHQRGIVSLAVNNAATVVRPNLWGIDLRETAGEPFRSTGTGGTRSHRKIPSRQFLPRS